MNQQQITATLCINKNIPRSTCHGKCHLRAQLKKMQHGEDAKQNTTPKIKLQDIDPFVLENLLEGTSSIGDDINDNLFYTSCTNLYCFQWVNNFLKPPSSKVA
ncbi:MAG: hypothetical protein IPI46_04850 [Bacteroidetes bacterium]|nr:hypothetical protein [Bacteroidota bacterium]